MVMLVSLQHMLCYAMYIALQMDSGRMDQQMDSGRMDSGCRWISRWILDADKQRF